MHSGYIHIFGRNIKIKMLIGHDRTANFHLSIQGVNDKIPDLCSAIQSLIFSGPLSDQKATETSLRKIDTASSLKMI
ncbi:hypothetical protein SDC9_166662 [bioreactor metagenome]|uniref:Uncharacterized protein n=1 Tax=bioreactor metagenome TaxID=1076179 RepID=A0A645FXX3_9ZZZZ